MSRPEEMQNPLYGHAEVLGFIDGMAERLAPRLHPDTALIGIHTGGVWVAERLRERLAIEPPIGELDIAFYRDDFSQIGMHPSVRPSKLPFEVDGRHIALIDDILYTGRTVRAALNEVFDYGRPASVLLAVLVDRGGRQLPIQPDAAGTILALGHDEHVKLTGPDPLALRLHRIAQAPSA
jgi:pyrimidine operon attenuation protein / uracil phosphoribosyltransferase